jgi:hypothetical protein
MRTITPTGLSPWEGTPVEGEKYTRQQLHVMKLKRPNWTWFAERMVTLTEPLQRNRPPADPVIVPCPIIAWTRCKTRVMIITPSGECRWINAQPRAGS